LQQQVRRKVVAREILGLTGYDGAGLGAIGAAYRQALSRGRRLTVIGAPPTLRAALPQLRLDNHGVTRDEAPSAADDSVIG
jgi:anti-anti-sigma regulatory factor